ncbi:class I SAM-dependent methyltransferase [Polynucleobacter sp. MWH-UH23A]|uniref:class I SAM-dependent methyltransferase n=1 Tax=Polynucleobacter sp. MWH-UH23A TaxID=1855613 RepID=UPI003364FE39
MDKKMLCRVCDSQNLEPVIDLGDQPWCNNFLSESQVGKEDYYPLKVMYCKDCSTAQLNFTVKKEIMFGNHTYLSGVTRSLSDHFAKIAQDVDQLFSNKYHQKSILDIGSNDGTQLKHYKTLGWSVLGVESSRVTSEIANKGGIDTINKFFNLETMKEIGRKFDVINAAGVFFHLEELHSVTEGIKLGLKEDGTFVVQFLYMKSIMENIAFDQIYHEHLLYYTLQTLQTLLGRHGLQLYDAYLTPIHGGQMIGYVTHAGNVKKSQRLLDLEHAEKISQCNDIKAYHLFHQKILKIKEDNRNYLISARKLGKVIYGMGAPVKGNTLLNYFDIGPDIIECLLEKNPMREGLFSPGKHIPIVMEEKIKKHPDIYYVLAWNFKEEILQNNKDAIDQGVEFYFPVNPRSGNFS